MDYITFPIMDYSMRLPDDVKDEDLPLTTLITVAIDRIEYIRPASYSMKDTYIGLSSGHKFVAEMPYDVVKSMLDTFHSKINVDISNHMCYDNNIGRDTNNV